jgi:hypothetical protein
MRRGGLLRGARGAVAVLALCLAACTGGNPRHGGAARAPTAAAPQALPPGWGRIKPLLEAGQQRAAARDVPGLKALAPQVNREGLSLLQANMPNDVARPDVPRYLEGRSLFGKALVEFARAVETGDRDPDLPDLFTRVAESWHAWMRAMRGLPPERTL